MKLSDIARIKQMMSISQVFLKKILEKTQKKLNPLLLTHSIKTMEMSKHSMQMLNC